MFVAEHVIPSPADPHFARLFDIHLLCTGIGRERTSEEYAELLAASGWRHTGTQRPSDGMIRARPQIIESTFDRVRYGVYNRSEYRMLWG